MLFRLQGGLLVRGADEPSKEAAPNSMLQPGKLNYKGHALFIRQECSAYAKDALWEMGRMRHK